MTPRVAALYVLARSSPYAQIPGVDRWPMKRDARLYRGPGPVVAHAPCGPWSRCVSHRTHVSAEQDPTLAVAAVFQVRRYGGSFEHPRRSRIYDLMTLPRPLPRGTSPMLAPRDAFGGFAIEVHQCDWGHASRKSTWLYFVGVDPAAVVLPPPTEPPPVKRVDMRVRKPGQRAYPRSASDLASSQERKRTPLALAQWLVDLATTATRPGAKGC